MKNMIEHFDALERADRIREARMTLLKVVTVLLALGLVAWQLVEMDAFADEGKVDAEIIAAQPWLIDRPEEVVVEEEVLVDNFWGYEWTPVVVTWYGKHVRKLKHELDPFREFGAQADGVEAKRLCKEHVELLEKILDAAVTRYKAVDFGYEAGCQGRYIVKVVEEDEETEDKVQAEES